MYQQHHIPVKLAGFAVLLKRLRKHWLLAGGLSNKACGFGSVKVTVASSKHAAPDTVHAHSLRHSHALLGGAASCANAHTNTMASVSTFACDSCSSAISAVLHQTATSLESFTFLAPY